ncbi:hypothetical protein [Leucobacter sp. wl10]|uniref:hypothetical protein n=1 Tax=Leucobacter sp. wl10 TaxID=2304677 RepID=UPI0013C2FF79|nr:hypothetical protein [Leucobacter sp. wl10]
MSMLDDAGDSTKYTVEKAREREQARHGRPSDDNDEDSPDTSGEVPVDNLE